MQQPEASAPGDGNTSSCEERSSATVCAPTLDAELEAILREAALLPGTSAAQPESNERSPSTEQPAQSVMELSSDVGSKASSTRSLVKKTAVQISKVPSETSGSDVSAGQKGLSHQAASPVLQAWQRYYHAGEAAALWRADQVFAFADLPGARLHLFDTDRDVSAGSAANSHSESSDQGDLARALARYR